MLVIVVLAVITGVITEAIMGAYERSPEAW